jgi:hypothetical protein
VPDLLTVMRIIRLDIQIMLFQRPHRNCATVLPVMQDHDEVKIVHVVRVCSFRG